MSFLLCCPNCGERSVYEFRFGGEFHQRPAEAASLHEWADYVYARRNEAGIQKEWWYHQLGCGTWFFAVRDTTTNTVRETFRVEDDRRES
jgi:sarcosine oxidase, subunit delta